MSLTSKREKILRSFRLKSLGNADRRYEHIDRFCRGTSPEKMKGRKLGFTQKMRRAISRGLRHAISFLPSWQRFIRSFVDRIIPYKKYELPADIYVNETLIHKNRKFLRALNERATASSRKRADLVMKTKSPTRHGTPHANKNPSDGNAAIF